MSIEENISELKRRLPEDINLIAVSKTKSADMIKEAYNTGIRDFGENKVQELTDKIDKLPDDINWHFIGHLQTNKVKYIVGKVSLIHSLDSVKLLKEIEKQYKKENLTADVLLEINIGKEESKSGIFAEDLDDIISECEMCEHVKVRGLMAIIPKGDENSCRNYFRQMKSIWDTLNNKSYNNVSMEYLSMGMTTDYELAIEEGSNMIRIGTGIFGLR
ncbi:pyridoxal phosphate enzyme, YggS family [Clostridiales bacterium oral taxon 876 str. F0540]|nr:pyridoxal phosphate enzyme, YggS family [Clostridiales bacterium oral taxon 876 str. F0540]